VHAWIPPLCTDIKRLVLSNEVKWKFNER
jgi:hypothetical protein